MVWEGLAGSHSEWHADGCLVEPAEALTGDAFEVVVASLACVAVPTGVLISYCIRGGVVV